MSETKNYIQNWVSIEEITLTSFSGKTEDIRKYLLAIDIQEDIFMPVVSGSITLIDPHAFYEDFPIIGEELLTIKYKDYFSETITRTFTVFGVGAKEKSEGGKGSTYILNFCSEELLYSRYGRYSKSYKDKDTHTILNDAFSRVNPTKSIEVQQTVELQDYIATNVTPFEVCGTMCARAISTEGHIGSYLFFEDLSKFNFVSIEKLISKAPIAYHIGMGASKSGFKADGFIKSRIIKNYRFIEPVSQLGALASGAHGVKTNTLCLMTRKLENTSYNHFDDEDYQKTNRINSPNPDLRTTSSKYKHQSNEGVYKVMIKNTEDNAKSSKGKTMPRRYSVISTYTNGPKIHAELPFNATLTVGNMIEVKIPKEDERVNLPENDKFLSGKYLIILI